jgi:lambda family phage portal protein
MAKKKTQTLQSAFDSIRADYDMSRASRFVRRRTGVAPQGSGADYHYRTETQYYRDIEQARDMDRNDAVIGILADRRVDNIVQSGFKLDPKTGDKGLDLEIWSRWQEFSNDPDKCDIAGECTWSEIERHCARAESIDGDIVVTGTEQGSFQVIEAHSIQTKTKVDDTFLGVTTDRFGKRLQYHVLEETNVFGTKGDSTPIDVRDSSGRRQVFHIYNPKRVLQTRGVTQIAPVFSYAGMLEDINFAKLVQQQVVSCFAIFRKMAAGGSNLPGVAGYGESSTESTEGGTRQIEGISPGMEITGKPGEELQGFSPNVPNSEYFQQVKLIMQVLGVNFGLPLCLVLMDGSETNFSGWRGAVDEARKGFVADQLNLVRRLHKPAYEWWLSRLVEEDSEIRGWQDKSKIKLFQHNWNLPTWSYIEPVADAEGDATQLRNALTSPRRLHNARGGDWEETADEIIEDNAYAIEKAAKKAGEFNAANPTSPPLSWRDLIPLVMPAGQTIALQDPAMIEAQAAATEAEPVDPSDAPTSEMAGLSTLQFTRNRKAIKKLLDELATGQATEATTRVFLGGLGLKTPTVDALIADAMDGNVDTPELNADQPTAKGKLRPQAKSSGLSKLIAIDFDDTFTAAPDLWKQFIELAEMRGDTVVCVTGRRGSESDKAEIGASLPSSVEVYFAGLSAKRDYMKSINVFPDIWIDDKPERITNEAKTDA